jgi:hypothetical protein
MSSARSNAAARSRRAGGVDLPQQQNGAGAGVGKQQAGPVKLSVSDAIGLITLRLGRVEQIMQTMPVDGVSSAISGLDGNARIVDDTVFLNIVQRIEAIEKNQQQVRQELQTITKKIETAPKNSNVEKLSKEISEIKNSLLQLQTFTMQTNQRLSEMVLKEPSVVTPELSVNDSSSLEMGEQVIDTLTVNNLDTQGTVDEDEDGNGDGDGDGDEEKD